MCSAAVRLASAEAAAKMPTGPAPRSASVAASMAGSALSGEEPRSTIFASGFGRHAEDAGAAADAVGERGWRSAAR